MDINQEVMLSQNCQSVRHRYNMPMIVHSLYRHGINVDRTDDWGDNPSNMMTIYQFANNGFNYDPKKVDWVLKHVNRKEWNPSNINALNMIACVGKNCVMTFVDMKHWMAYFNLWRNY